MNIRTDHTTYHNSSYHFFEELCSLPLETYSCKFCNLKYKDYFKITLVHKQKSCRAIFRIVSFFLRAPSEPSPTLYLQHQCICGILGLNQLSCLLEIHVSPNVSFWETGDVFWLVEYNSYTLNLPFLPQ